MFTVYEKIEEQNYTCFLLKLSSKIRNFAVRRKVFDLILTIIIEFYMN